jgi:hypothetical protein
MRSYMIINYRKLHNVQCNWTLIHFLNSAFSWMQYVIYFIYAGFAAGISCFLGKLSTLYN